MTIDRPRIWSHAAQNSSGLGLALRKFMLSGISDLLRMKVKNAGVENWWDVREECRCHKIPQSLNRRERPGSFARPGWSWGLPRTPPAFTLTTSPKASAVLSLLTLSILPAAMVQARENYGRVAILRTQAGLTSWVFSSSVSVSSGQPETIMGGGI